MNDEELAQTVKRRALALGYEKCGIIKADEMLGYANALTSRINEYPADRLFLESLARFSDVRATAPWTQSVIILSRPFGKYRIPELLRDHFASVYLVSETHIPDSRENADSQAFGESLADLGIMAITDRKHGLTAMRWAAQKAGIGIIRKNNFLYTESGSWVYLSVWLIDHALELKEKCSLRPCPENCHRCIDACPTSALKRPYSTQPTACISCITGFDEGDLKSHPANRAMSQWIYGCDACQTACPHNRTPGRETEEHPALKEFEKRFSLAGILDMSNEDLKSNFGEKFWYISEDRLWKWKVNALNAMNNGYKEEYLPAIEKACHDPEPMVRSMALWVMQSVGKHGV